MARGDRLEAELKNAIAREASLRQELALREAAEAGRPRSSEAWALAQRSARVETAQEFARAIRLRA
ncbi:MAG: hypothetical protein JNM70_25270 [Anaerolineae bacterium]|nr:hypothetical protein [Anaerolineae bacterium]